MLVRVRFPPRLLKHKMIKYSTRVAIILKNIVIKIPVTRRGYLQGVHEKRMWDKYKDTVSLAELKWMFVGIVCQKRYQNDLQNIPVNIVKAYKSKISEFDFENCDLHNPKNWGYDEQGYVLLDYGINQYIASLY